MLTVTNLVGFGADNDGNVVGFEDFSTIIGDFVEFPNVTDDFWNGGWKIDYPFAGIIGQEDFETLATGDPTSSDLDNGLGWSGAWVVEEPYFGIKGRDTFEMLSLGDPTEDSLNTGSGFTGAWLVETPYLGTKGWDFIQYTPGDPTGDTLNQGSGWTGSWVEET